MLPLPILRASIRMEPGDTFVALSDGVVDAERIGGERFGTARVIEVVTRHCRSSAAELTAALREAVADFTGRCEPRTTAPALWSSGAEGLPGGFRCRVADSPAARYGIYARSLQARKETRSCPHPPHRNPSSVRSSTP